MAILHIQQLNLELQPTSCISIQKQFSISIRGSSNTPPLTRNSPTVTSTDQTLADNRLIRKICTGSNGCHGQIIRGRREASCSPSDISYVCVRVGVNEGESLAEIGQALGFISRFIL